MMSAKLCTAWMIAGTLAVASAALVPAWAEEPDPAALAAALKDAKVTLQQGLKASERDGKPISAKFEIEDGKLQLSVYTLKGDSFTEVVADPKTGAITKAEKITDPEDLEAATQQKGAMEKATVSLLTATEKVVKANTGFRAVSVLPAIEGGHPTAAVTLLQNETFKTVAEKLD